MKKVNLTIAVLCFFLLSMSVKAQSKTGADYFTGKWNVLVKGTPNGDSQLIMVLDKKDSTLTGVIQDTTGKEIAKIDKIDVSGDKLTVYFTAQGYDVNLELNKKSDDHVAGSLMGMFDSEGERIKQLK